MLDKIIKLFSSLRLTVVLLSAALLLVFVGTLAQVHEGLYQAQHRYFRSFVVYWNPGTTSLQIPVFPGGYTVGILLLINLTAAHIQRFELNRRKMGIFLAHAGIIALLLGQLLTDGLSVESALRLNEGESRNYTEDFRANELVLIDTSDKDHDTVVAIPDSELARTPAARFNPAQLPFTVEITRFWENAELLRQPATGSIKVEATKGIGVGLNLIPKTGATAMDDRNYPSALVTLKDGSQTVGSWLVSTVLGAHQTFEHKGRTYDLALRFRRHYTQHTVTLLEARHDVYQGTDIPKNYSSRVRVQNPATGEDREVLIYMNNPLRYAGLTYYQFQMGRAEAGSGRSSTLQVVRNPSWITPYVGCVIVSAGLLIQFLTHLAGFARRRTQATPTPNSKSNPKARTA